MEEEDLLGSLEFSDDEDYVISLNELHNQAELDSDDDVHVPLLEVSPSTGSLQSLAFSDSMVNESFRKYHPDKKWIFDFPYSFENFLRPFDDRLIPIIQFTNNKVLEIISSLITFAVAIEIMFAVPFILFALGIDGLASEFTYLGLFLAIISQIPKRFIWRYRPWMVQRANKIRTSSTSSFPSRAVCCSIVYAYAICYAYCYFTELQIVWWWMPELFIIMFLLSSFARIFLGVHYPSDCIIGAIQGVIICLLGTLLWQANLLGCSTCHDNLCYSTVGSDEELTADNLKDMSWIPFMIVIVLSFILTILAVVRPINFWRKCDRSLGLLLPCVAFQVGFLCPEGSKEGASLAPPEMPPPFWSYLIVIVPVIGLLIGHKLKSRYPLISFTALYLIMFLCLFVWRLFIYPV